MTLLYPFFVWQLVQAGAWTMYRFLARCAEINEAPCG